MGIEHDSGFLTRQWDESPSFRILPALNVQVWKGCAPAPLACLYREATRPPEWRSTPSHSSPDLFRSARHTSGLFSDGHVWCDLWPRWQEKVLRWFADGEPQSLRCASFLLPGDPDKSDRIDISSKRWEKPVWTPASQRCD